ncbi:hypothetical protein H9L13_12455 [Sphingomonas lutea]|uniref:Uncharacterized protein n=1 Tax=Sphingomonas lutea TaxID=1045317 RepID=A0A7G9SHQ8_9SPHN|nr:hypothetical protein [Sphingomonas lutea]QNN67383.1 hypothetical protein H9L13_12455 [Sphingomonas lutea]
MTLSVTAALAACAAVPAPPPTVPPPPPCPVMSSSDWRAWVNAMPGPGSRPTLHVQGNVTLPSADWTARFVGSRVMESYPVQVVVELDATSSGMGAQVPVTREVRGSWPSEQNVGAVSVMCHGQTLARISPVKTAY